MKTCCKPLHHKCEETKDCKPCGYFGEPTQENPSALIGLLDTAIRVFEERKKEYDDWYMGQKAVSAAIIFEHDELMKKCDWAIELLKRDLGI